MNCLLVICFQRCVSVECVKGVRTDDDDGDDD